MYFNPPSMARGAPSSSMLAAAVASGRFAEEELHPPVSAGVAVGSGGDGVLVAVTMIGVAVGGTGVAVGGTGVLVGVAVTTLGVAVSVGGTGVSVGGAGVSVGGIGVSVAGASVGIGVGTPINTRLTTLNVPGS